MPRVVKVRKGGTRGIPNRVSSKLSPRAQAYREREQKALELRKARVTFQQIADALGYAGPAGAKMAVDRAIARQGFEAAREVVLLDLATLDEMQMRLMERVRAGDLRYIDNLLRVLQQRYSLLGVSARTVKELQEKMGIDPEGPPGLAQVTNNGVMVIQGTSETEFVRSMMEAVGVDTSSPAAQKKLLELESKESKRNKKSGKTDTPAAGTKKRVVRRKINKSKKAPVGDRSTEAGDIEGPYIGGNNTTPNSGGSSEPIQYPELTETEIIDAEIVEDDEPRALDELHEQQVIKQRVRDLTTRR